jgi:hypothetical protein
VSGLGVVTVHCFFSPCRYTVKGSDPKTNQAVMEQHYENRHQRELAAWIGAA